MNSVPSPRSAAVVSAVVCALLTSPFLLATAPPAPPPAAGRPPESHQSLASSPPDSASPHTSSSTHAGWLLHNGSLLPAGWPAVTAAAHSSHAPPTGPLCRAHPPRHTPHPGPSPPLRSTRQAEAPVRFRWPLAPPHPVLRPFEAPLSPYGPGHRGIDLAGSVDEPVLAAAEGVVVFAGQVVDRCVVSVDHANGLRTTYEPVTPVVAAGKRVTAGTVLGHLRPGHAGCPGAPACLHWGVRRSAEYLDPLVLVSVSRIRLLPWKEDGD